MSANAAQLRAAWHRAAHAWPADALRPQHQFADAIRTAADRALADTRTLSPAQQEKATEAASAMHRLVENRALKAHPMTERTTKPASFPKHYSRIQDSIARAERGEVFKTSRFSQWFRWK
ncbi:ubiquinol-cytochrome c reductase complex assembly factor 2 [Rhodotorula paludigena]|uniref:ubiquinol-cytochrome c reductase complex assembly factor 2 n=1 Tax=Rhodotorula paludigena TaxID=86838 RepID=UPI00317938B3